MSRLRARCAVWLSAVAIIGAVLVVRPHLDGLSFVVRAADMQGVIRWLADVRNPQGTERLLHLPMDGKTMRARLYWPDDTPRRTVLLVSGLNPAGIDEPGLVALARQLSATNVAVLTPDIPELSQLAVTPAITDSIERAALWLVSTPDLTPDHRVGLMGISFSGGLSIVAAGRPSLANRVAYVFAFGAHYDLPRVLQYLCTGLEPASERGGPPIARPPHDYGVAIILLGVAERLVPADQVDLLRGAVRRFLWASYLDRVDQRQADREFAALRQLAPQLPEPSATLLGYVNDRDVAHLGPRLLPFVGIYGDAPALSPSKSPKPSAPVFLLHGTEDNVIPAIESEYLADDLRGHAPVRLLLSGLISHARVDQPARLADVVELVDFWGDLLGR